MAMPGRRFLFDIGCHGPVPPLWYIPLRSSWSLGGVEVTGVGQAAWRYSWMRPLFAAFRGPIVLLFV